MSTKKHYYLKTPGKILIAAAVLGLVIAICRIFNLGAVFRYFFGGATYSNADFGIADYISPVDRDGDGIDDQSDILAGARAYVSTKPEYKSSYYKGGYPDDGYGVCTDVVAQALKAAGYDLMELVSADIERNRSDYDADVGDRNIDFRRVRNLIVYFRHTAKELTTDIGEIGEWQGGDIVVFEGHIGIVSDRRNKNGTPLVIHHGSSNQPHYEQDILELRDDIVGHFRVT